MDDERLIDALADLRGRLEGQHLVFCTFALAMLSTHPDPAQVMRRFRGLLEHATDPELPALDDAVLGYLESAARAFDQMVQLAVPSTDPQHSAEPD